MTSATDLLVIPRADFLERYWQYDAGQHVTIIGHTGSGKTQLGMDLLAITASPALPSVTFVMKPVDPTVSRFAKAHGHRVVQDYPLPRVQQWWQGKRKPNGYILWPPHTYGLDPDEDERRMAWSFIHAMRHAMRTGKHIVVCDEAVELCELETEKREDGKKPIKVERWVNAMLARGRSGGTGGWMFTQRAAYLNQKAYSGASHLFLAKEPDARNRKRYEEIGGVDSGLVADTTRRLKPYYFLYIRRTDNTMCIVGP